ncbi:MAG: alpha-amylase family protein [Clostridiaceae bacterium]|nr:alpha-amylase family protein [Clostridiaceae bacterium]
MDLRFRQIHLDFHTSEKISTVAGRFNAEQFADTLKKAYVNSVTCFSRCHHGLLYYDSKRFPELVHPGLKERNLLERQIAACHKQNIRVPIYTTVQWDYHASTKHPEWVCLNRDGSLVYYCREGAGDLYKPGFYRTLCVNTGYRDYLKAQIADVFTCVAPENVDGIFLDIVSVVDCSCQHCVVGMLKNGYDPENRTQRLLYAKGMMDEFKRDMTRFIHVLEPGASVFYNCGHINPSAVDAQDAYTHWELESLPSGDWGYSHFVNTIRYARTTGFDCLAHTGKFHTSWGDFHSFKNKEALQYECMRMLAYNSKCLIGDQLEPDGMISQPVYDLIGSVYQEVAEKEPWCIGAKALCDIALFTQEGLNVGTCGCVPDEINGACTMLDELGLQFDIVDRRTDWHKYRLLILPDTIVCDDELAARIDAYAAGGGKVLASCRSGLNRNQDAFALACLGIQYSGQAPYSPDFLLPTDTVGKNLPKTEHVMYQPGMLVGQITAETLVYTYTPYFNRTWDHFCSHKHTPSSHQQGYPGILRNGPCIYFIHPVFGIYQKNHPKWCKELVNDVIRLLLPEVILEHDGPSTLVATVNHQELEKRYVLHLLHYIPVKASADMFTIEDVIPLYHISCRLNLPQEIKSIMTVPAGLKIPFRYEKQTIHVTVPEIHGHCMLELNY